MGCVNTWVFYCLQAVAKLHSILRPFLLRRLKADVEQMLPQKKEIILYATLTEHQKNFQDHLIDKTLEDHLREKVDTGIRLLSVVRRVSFSFFIYLDEGSKVTLIIWGFWKEEKQFHFLWFIFLDFIIFSYVTAWGVGLFCWALGPVGYRNMITASGICFDRNCNREFEQDIGCKLISLLEHFCLLSWHWIMVNLGLNWQFRCTKLSTFKMNPYVCGDIPFLSTWLVTKNFPCDLWKTGPLLFLL